jgi:hypothetical protein
MQKAADLGFCKQFVIKDNGFIIPVGGINECATTGFRLGRVDDWHFVSSLHDTLLAYYLNMRFKSGIVSDSTHHW